MPEFSRPFKELADAFKNSNHPGLWIPSAEGGWTTPSEEDWGKPAPAAGSSVEKAPAK